LSRTSIYIFGSEWGAVFILGRVKKEEGVTCLWKRRGKKIIKISKTQKSRDYSPKIDGLDMKREKKQHAMGGKGLGRKKGLVGQSNGYLCARKSVAGKGEKQGDKAW